MKYRSANNTDGIATIEAFESFFFKYCSESMSESSVFLFDFAHELYTGPVSCYINWLHDSG